MLIQVIGADGTGKSTLVDKMHNVVKQHNTKPRPEDTRESVLKHYLDTMDTYHTTDGLHLVLDRNWWCEYVYGDAIRDGSLLSLQDCLDLTKHAHDKWGTLIIHCTGNDRLIYENMMRRGDDLISKQSEITAIVNKYNEAMVEARKIVPVLNYSIFKGDCRYE